MNIESVKTLFCLFSGEDHTEQYTPVIRLAMTETEKILRPDADMSDIRLDFLAAAMAHYRVRQLHASQDRSRYTYAGKMAASVQAHDLVCAEKLLRDYYSMCSDLIVPQTFFFMGVASGKEEF